MLNDFQSRNWQTEAIAGLRQNTFLEVHRRGGKSYLLAYLASRQLLLPLNNRSVLFISPLLKQTRLNVWNFFKSFLSAYPMIQFNNTDNQITNNQTGSRILLLGMSDPDGNRGLEGHVVCVDEIGFIKYDEYHSVITPFVAETRGSLLLSGTPPMQYDLFSEQRDFHRTKATTDPEHYSFLSFPVSRTDVFTDDEITTLRQRSPRSFQREYMLNPSKGDELTYMPQELLAELATRDHDEYIADQPPVAGFDVALKRDSSVLCIRHDHHLPLILEVNGTPSEQTAAVYRAMNQYKCHHLGVDSGGLGEAFTEPLERLTNRDIKLDVYYSRFNERADDPSKDANKRSMLYHRLQDWLYQSSTCLPQHHELLVDLGAQRLKQNDKNQFAMELKKDIKDRIGRSCDYSDALCLTFVMGEVSVSPEDILDTDTLPRDLSHMSNAEVMEKFPDYYSEAWQDDNGGYYG